MTAQNIILEPSFTTTSNVDKEAKTSSIVIADTNNINNDDSNDNDINNNKVWPINDTLQLRKKEIAKLLEQENSQGDSESLSPSINSFSSSSSTSYTTVNEAPSSSSSSSNENEISSSTSTPTPSVLENENDHDDKVERENDEDIEMTDSPIDISSSSQQQTSTITTPPLPSLSSSPSSSLHTLSSLPSLPTDNLPDPPKVKNLPRRNRSVSFNHTVTFIPHVPPPPTKIRKKLSKEATTKQKDVIVEIEDLGKVRVDGKNGRVIKITPFSWPGPLNGYGKQNGGHNNDIDMNSDQAISSPRSSTSRDEDDDVLIITAVPVVEKHKKLRIGKHFKRYYNKLIPHHNHQEGGGEKEEEEVQVQEQQQQV